MTRLHYQRLLFEACDRKDVSVVEMIAILCEEAEAAKQVLRDKGYGVTGTSLLNTCKEVPPYGLAFIPDPDPIKEDATP